MTITFTTTITSVKTYPIYQNISNYVFEINWSYKGDDEKYNTAMSGSTSVPVSDLSSAIPYVDLTKEQIMGWIIEYTDPLVFEDYSIKITDWITAQYTPSVITPPLPWIE